MKKYLLILVTVVSVFSCRTDDAIVADDDSQTPEVPDVNTVLKGFYLVNEGNMSMNKASLDYMDFETGEYKHERFKANNPTEVGGLGDVANDIGIYGSKMYIVVNASNKVEVLDVNTGVRLKQINVDNCRYITFYEGKAYLSTYLGTIGDPNSPLGQVNEIDTTSLTITRKVDVGRQPEELVAYDNKIYVANSGGYSPPEYESTISVIDIPSFTETKRIEVAKNLHRLKIDSEGDLYVSSRGDYFETPSNLFVVDTKTDQVKKTFNLAASNFTIHNDIAYIYSTEFSYLTGGFVISYNMLDTKTETVLEGSFIAEGNEDLIQTPYGIAINPDNEDIYITDAKDYFSPGDLYCFDSEGEFKWKVETGDIPSKIQFVYQPE
ncbi:YncE family protein [Formosa sp. 4Alg 33]|uniref:YncE family protein n=1 Tax=Formosa sp. 4Alg 33 TaxID=3382189 RepID=UPI003D9C0D71